jgi:hypothetical protein
MYDLAPLDYYFMRESEFTMKFALEFQGRIDRERVKRAILDLQFYEPILRSGIAYEDEKTVCLKPLKNYELDFASEESNIDLPDEIIRNRFLPIQNLPEKNLLKFKLIEGPRKSYLLVSMSHLLGDGSSFFLILKAICDFYNGENYQAFVHKRLELNSMAPTLSHLSDDELNNQVFKYSGYTHEGIGRHESFLTEELKFSQPGLAKLMEISKSQGLRLSTHVLLMSLMTKEKYQHMTKFKGRILLRSPVDYRRKLDLSPNFFGNAIVDAHLSFDLEEIQQNDVFGIAIKIKEAIQEINFQYIYKHLSALKTLRERKGIAALRSLRCPGTVFTNFSQMPLDKITFDSASPLRLIHGELYPNFVLMMAATRDRYPLIFHH